MKLLKFTTAICLCFLFVLLTGCSDSTGSGDKKDWYEMQFPVKLQDGIMVTEGFLKSGPFPEDGSFEHKNDVFALVVRNISGKDIQLTRIYVTTDENEYFFEITTLPSDAEVTVFEKTGKSVSDNENFIGIRAENTVFFEKKISLQSETFLITTFEKVINIKNISEENIDSDIYVYYKKTDENGRYYGGITFRTKAEKLNSGELKQIPASHFSPEDSEMLFADYVQQ